MSAMSTKVWTIEAFCQQQQQQLIQSLPPDLPDSSQSFLQSLDLPSLHPFCKNDDSTTTDYITLYNSQGVPGQGPLLNPYAHWDSWWQIVHSTVIMIAPPLISMAELWLRLLAMLFAPLGITYMITSIITMSNSSNSDAKQKEQRNTTQSLAIIITMLSSLIIMTDTGYVNEFGPKFGISLFIVSLLLSGYVTYTRNMNMTLLCVFCITCLAAYMVYDGSTGTLSFGHATERYNITEGTYYDTSNPRASAIVDNWPVDERVYDLEHGMTWWQPSGDARTGLPFVMNTKKTLPKYVRRWLPVDNGEALALDIAMPESGHSTEKPVILVLHGLNGGSTEEFVKDLVYRRNADGSTVIVMIARGLMDVPIKGWDLFHGARTSDIASAAQAVKRAIAPDQILAGIGFSMGAIIINNYVARYGKECALDAAVSVSGGLDMRTEYDFYRAQRLWQPMLCATLRNNFVLGKWGERIKARLSKHDMQRLFQATHVTHIDETAIVAYNSYRDVIHYYSEMSALGDVTEEEYSSNNILPHRRIHNVSIPLCVIHALDDPLVTWRTVAANSGAMRPDNLVKTGSGNLFLLLTKAGGHVGWPLSSLPIDGWKWMHDTAYSFILAVDKLD